MNITNPTNKISFNLDNSDFVKTILSRVGHTKENKIQLDSTRNLMISCSVLSLMEELMFKLTQYPIKIFKLRSEIISSNNEIAFLDTECRKLILKKLVFFN